MALRLVGEGKPAASPAIRGSVIRSAFLVFTIVICAIANTSAREMGPRETHGNFSVRSGIALSANLPAGTTGIPYSGSISAVGGVAPYSYTIADGSLPSGLALNSQTGAVSGTPTAAVSK